MNPKVEAVLCFEADIRAGHQVLLPKGNVNSRMRRW